MEGEQGTVVWGVVSVSEREKSKMMRSVILKPKKKTDAQGADRQECLMSSACLCQENKKDKRTWTMFEKSSVFFTNTDM